MSRQLPHPRTGGRAWAMALGLLMGAACAAAPEPVAQRVQAVQVGGDTELDACALAQLRAPAELRAAPAADAPVRQPLPAHQRLWRCDLSADGQWVGVLVSQGSEGCGVSTPWPTRRPYDGPCVSGWLRVGALQTEAG